MIRVCADKACKPDDRLSTALRGGPNLSAVEDRGQGQSASRASSTRPSCFQITRPTSGSTRAGQGGGALKTSCALLHNAARYIFHAERPRSSAWAADATRRSAIEKVEEGAGERDSALPERARLGHLTVGFGRPAGPRSRWSGGRQGKLRVDQGHESGARSPTSLTVGDKKPSARVQVARSDRSEILVLHPTASEGPKNGGSRGSRGRRHRDASSAAIYRRQTSTRAGRCGSIQLVKPGRRRFCFSRRSAGAAAADPSSRRSSAPEELAAMLLLLGSLGDPGGPSRVSIAVPASESVATPLRGV